MTQQETQEREATRRKWRDLERSIVARAATMEPKAFLDVLTQEEREHIAAIQDVRDGRTKGYRLSQTGHDVLTAVHGAMALAGQLPPAALDAVLTAQARRERRQAKRKPKEHAHV